MRHRLIQVGLGDFGRRWLSVIHAHPGWEYAAIATRNEEVRSRCGSQLALTPDRLFASLDDAVGTDADLVLVTTPHFRHLADVRTALAGGYNVLVEKPLAGSWDECLAIRDLARRSSGFVMVGENYRFGAGARLAREVVASGEIGSPEFLSMDYFVGHTFPRGDWRNDYQYPVLVENATHQFDLVRYVTGAQPETVFCSAAGSRRTPHWSWPNVSVQFTMSGGFLFQFGASWAYSELETPWEGVWRLHGSDGSLLWTRDRIEVVAAGVTRVIDVPSQESDHTLEATFCELDRAISEHRVPVPDVEDNMNTVAMVYGAIRSHQTGAPVSVAEMLG